MLPPIHSSYSSPVSVLTLFCTAAIAFSLQSCTAKEIPQSAMAQFINAKISYERGNLAHAFREFETLTSAYPQFPEARLMAGKSALFLENPSRAEEILKDLADDYPEYYEAGFWLSTVELYMDDTEAAKRGFLELLSKNSQDFRVYHNLGLIAMEQAEYDVALDYLRRGLLMKEEFAHLALSLGQLYYSQGLFEEARESLEISQSIVEPGGAIAYAIEEILARLPSE